MVVHEPFAKRIVRVTEMTAESEQLSSLNREDLVNIMKRVKDMGSNKKEISTEDFVKAIEGQLLDALSRTKSK